MSIAKEAVKKRDKEQTKRRLINAVGEIIMSEGHPALGVNRIAKQAGVHKKLIYRYFGNVDTLIEAYVIEKDYWILAGDSIKSLIAEINESSSSVTELMASLLKQQLDFFFDSEEMQRIILWEVSEKSDIMRSIANVREAMKSDLLELADKHFQGSEINFRGVGAIISAGIYYLVMNAKTNGSTFYEIDLQTEEGREEIRKSIQLIIELVCNSVLMRSD